jgi:hypothetical protein
MDMAINEPEYLARAANDRDPWNADKCSVYCPGFSFDFIIFTANRLYLQI